MILLTFDDFVSFLQETGWLLPNYIWFVIVAVVVVILIIVLLPHKKKETFFEEKSDEEKDIITTGSSISNEDAEKEDEKVNEIDDSSTEVVDKNKKVYSVYHITQVVDINDPRYRLWRIRKAGSAKVILYCKTQKEAIEKATLYANNYGGRIVIHKKDGSIRKLTY